MPSERMLNIAQINNRHPRACDITVGVGCTCKECIGLAGVLDCVAADARAEERERCWICGKLKGQPPGQCPGHYYVPAMMENKR